MPRSGQALARTTWSWVFAYKLSAALPPKLANPVQHYPQPTSSNVGINININETTPLRIGSAYECDQTSYQRDHALRRRCIHFRVIVRLKGSDGHSESVLGMQHRSSQPYNLRYKSMCWGSIFTPCWSLCIVSRSHPSSGPCARQTTQSRSGRMAYLLSKHIRARPHTPSSSLSVDLVPRDPAADPRLRKRQRSSGCSVSPDAGTAGWARDSPKSLLS
jgi:hypothetical protein